MNVQTTTLLLLSLSLLSFSHLFGQATLHTIHPLVGDTIDASENERYQLFKDSALTSLEVSYVLVEDSAFQLFHVFPQDSIAQESISTLQVEELGLRIDRAESFHRMTNSEQSPSSQNQEIMDLRVTDPAFQKNLDAEYTKKYWDDKNKETQQQIRQGAWAPQMEVEVIEFELNKKKK